MLAMLKIVSVSLGSSKRDKTTATRLLDEDVSLQRTGTDGDLARAIQLIGELDPQVDAFGLGGIDLYLCAGGKKWPIRDAFKLKRAAKTAPVADGSILKLQLEPRLVDWLAENFTEVPLKGSKALLVSAVDRWGMAESLARHCGEVIFGDLLYAIGLPFPLRTIKAITVAANWIAPVITQLPFKLLYPTGSQQHEHKPKHTEFFIWADWICGDFHYIRRNMPPRLDGKVVLTNTTTAEDQELLAQRGLRYLITTTPVIDGRSFGMNVLEAALLALMRRNRDMADHATFEVYLNRLDLKPNIIKLN
jgi:hypothetical protein